MNKPGLLWLPVLGPSATWALRRLGAMVTARPDGVEVNVASFATTLGLGGGTGRNATLIRTIARLVSFGMAAWQGEDLLVRRTVGPLTARQLQRLEPPLRQLHERLLAARTERRAG